MSTMKDIEQRTKVYAEAREKLSEAVQTLREAQRELEVQNLPRIRRLLDRCVQLGQELKKAVEESPELFTKPKTKVMHGIQVGFQKSKGKLTWADEEKVVALIRKKMPEQFQVLVKTEHHPIRDALSNLTVDQLRSLGCEVSEAGDTVVVRAVGSDLDKLVAAMLKGLRDEAAVAEAEAG